jgi:hypothetical protein
VHSSGRQLPKSRLTDQSVALTIKTLAARAGLDPGRYAAQLAAERFGVPQSPINDACDAQQRYRCWQLTLLPPLVVALRAAPRASVIPYLGSSKYLTRRLECRTNAAKRKDTNIWTRKGPTPSSPTQIGRFAGAQANLCAGLAINANKCYNNQCEYREWLLLGTYTAS